MALRWQDKKASYLHLVDLDGALAGRSVNEEVIKEIVRAVDIPVQLGGGIRSAETVERMLLNGIARVIIGTKAVERPEFMRELVERFGPERIVAGVDAKNGQVAIEGWGKLSDISALDLCLQMKAFGIRHVVYTDIARDGMMSGPNVEYTKHLTRETEMDIIASGGVSSMEDLDTLCREGIKGAIIGKALYEGTVDLEEAVRRYE